MKVKKRVILAGMALVGMTGLAVADSQAPIGVFDSGVGGLTVLEKLLSVDVVSNVTGERGGDCR